MAGTILQGLSFCGKSRSDGFLGSCKFLQEIGTVQEKPFGCSTELAAYWNLDPKLAVRGGVSGVTGEPL